MRFVTNIHQLPFARQERFPKEYWPTATNPQDMEDAWIMLEFLTAACRPPDAAPRKLIPQRPDFECSLAGTPVRFELGEILQEALASGMHHSGKQSRRKADALAQGDEELAASIQTWGRNQYPANAALERILRKKLGKKYLCEGIPAELVLFYNTQHPYGPFQYLQQMEAELARILAASSFTKIWIYNMIDHSIMGTLQLIGNALQSELSVAMRDATRP